MRLSNSCVVVVVAVVAVGVVVVVVVLYRQGVCEELGFRL